MLKKENGIAMITLVITIIVTMILAGVSITYIVGEDNFLEQAEEAANIARVAGVQDLFQYYVAADYADDKDVFGELMANGYVKKINNQKNGSVFYITQNGMNAIADSYSNTSTDEIIYSAIPELVTQNEATITQEQFNLLLDSDVYLVDAAFNVAFLSRKNMYGTVYFSQIVDDATIKWWEGEDTAATNKTVVNWDKPATAQESFVLNPTDINNQGTITGFAITGADIAGTYKNGDLVIPSEIIITSGVGQVISVPVTKIADDAFSKEKENTIDITGNVYIPSSVIEIGKNAFQGQENITAVYIASEKIGNEAFKGCKNITSISFADNLVKVIGERAFSQIDVALTSINFSEGITEIQTEAFSKCSKLSNIVLPSTLTTLGNSVFQECSDGNKVIDLSRCTNLSVIPEKIFYKCNNIKSISFAEGLTKISKDAFAECKNCTIQDLTFPDSLLSIEDGAFTNTTAINGNIYIKSTTELKAENVFSKDYVSKIQDKK